MAEVLLIERADLVKFTVVDGNVDTDRFIQFIKIAQDIHIQSYLGTDLLNKLKADIEVGTLSGNYLSLLENFVKPMLIHWAMVEYLPFAAYTVANKGVYKHTSENSSGKSFYVPRSNPDGVSVNARCLSMDTVEVIYDKPFDGRNWEKHAASLAHLSKES